MDWPVILSAQPAKYLITAIEKLTSTVRAQLNVLPKQRCYQWWSKIKGEESLYLPLSKASRAANSSWSRSISWASFHNRSPLTLPGAFKPHVVSNAFCATSTAISTSSSVASETFVINFPLAKMPSQRVAKDPQKKNDELGLRTLTSKR